MKFLLIPSHNFTSVILLEILIELLALRYVHLLSLFLGQGSTVKAGWIVVFAFGVFIILVFLLATMLIYYEQWKISHRPLLSCGPPRGWRLRQLQGDAPPAPATDVPPPPAADSSLDYHIEEGELMLSESEEERMERTHTRLEDVQRCAESAAACLQAFRTATYSYRYGFFLES